MILIEARNPQTLTLLNVLILVIWLEGVLLGKATEGIDQMRAQVRVDILRVELGRTRPVHGPVCVVAYDSLVVLCCQRAAIMASDGTKCQYS